MEKCYTYNGQNLESGLLCVFQAPGNILFQRCKASMTQHRLQSTRVRAKGTDLVRSQVCSSLWLPCRIVTLQLDWTEALALAGMSPDASPKLSPGSCSLPHS